MTRMIIMMRIMMMKLMKINIGFGHMITLCMEASHRVSSVIDNLKFTLLIIISVSAVENTVGVALLISELSVISYSSIITKSVTMRSSLTMNLERNLLWLIIGFPFPC